MASDNPDIRSDDELWNEFHRVVNMTSRELEEWLRTRSAAPDAAGDAGWRHRLMSIGHDPLKPAS